MKNLSDLIKEKFGGNVAEFARYHSQHATQVHRWLSADAIVVEGTIYVPKAEVITASLKTPPAFGFKYWHVVDAVTPKCDELVVAKYWTGDAIDQDRLAVENVFESKASAEASTNG